MNKSTVTVWATGVLLFLLCIVPGFLFAADVAKFGSVDVQKVLNESDNGKKAKTDLEALIKSKQSTIDEKGKTIEKLKNDVEKQASVLSAEARKTKEDELEKSIREYQRLVQDSQAEIKKKEAELTDTILKDVHEIINKIGQEESYALILERGMVVYSDKGIDITDRVLKTYNESRSKSKK
jgi:outer membrane protein